MLFWSIRLIEGGEGSKKFDKHQKKFALGHIKKKLDKHQKQIFQVVP